MSAAESFARVPIAKHYISKASVLRDALPSRTSRAARKSPCFPLERRHLLVSSSLYATTR